MLATTSVRVNKVTCTNKKRADVTFDLVLNGQPAPGLTPPGSAVLDAKTWKMRSITVCNLFALADPTLLESGPCADIALEGEGATRCSRRPTSTGRGRRQPVRRGSPIR